MLHRITYGILALTIAFAVVVSDVVIAKEADRIAGPLGDLIRQGSAIPVVLVVLFLLGAAELDRLLRLKGVRPHTHFAYLMITLLMLTPWLSAAGWLGRGAIEVEGLYWQAVCLIAAFIGAGVLTVIRTDTNGALRDMGGTLLSVFFLGFLGSFAVQLRCGCDAPQQEGAWLLLIVVLVTKASDIGAFFVGSAIGRHKLIPRISPAKTVEGMFGGLLASAATAMAIAAVGMVVTDVPSPGKPAALLGLSTDDIVAILNEITRSFSMEQGHGSLTPVYRALIFGVSMSAVGQIGDLIESCFKRDAEIKDSAKVIPHFGGILDLTDSLIPAMPVAWFLLAGVWNVI